MGDKKTKQFRNFQHHLMWDWLCLTIPEEWVKLKSRWKKRKDRLAEG